jgi:hypothetical protein
MPTIADLNNIAPPPEASPVTASVAQKQRMAQQQVELGAQQQLSRIAQAPAAPVEKEAAAEELALQSQVQMGKTQADIVAQESQKSLEKGMLKANEAKLQRVRDIQQRKAELTQQQLKNEVTITALNSVAANRVYQEQIKFAKDESGRTFLNQTQLSDWAVMNAKSAEQLKEYEQDINQALERKRLILEAASKKILQKMEQDFAQADQEKQQQLRIQIIEFKAAADKARADAKAKASGTANIISAASTVVGGIASIWNPIIGAGIMTAGNMWATSEAQKDMKQRNETSRYSGTITRE